jgi:hypothetical protein
MGLSPGSGEEGFDILPCAEGRDGIRHAFRAQGRRAAITHDVPPLQPNLLFAILHKTGGNHRFEAAGCTRRMASPAAYEFWFIKGQTAQISAIPPITECS